MVTFGPCQVKDDSISYHCPCPAGTAVTTLPGVDIGDSCRICEHSLAKHLSYEAGSIIVKHLL